MYAAREGRAFLRGCCLIEFILVGKSGFSKGGTISNCLGLQLITPSLLPKVGNVITTLLKIDMVLLFNLG